MSVYKILRLTFLLNRCYCPLYHKWLHREFYRLPLLAEEIGCLVEECHTVRDMESAPTKLSEACRRLVEHQNQMGALPAVRPQPPDRLARGFFGFNCGHVADHIQSTIEGPLGDIPLDGAVDQWCTNEDFLLHAGKFRALSKVYRE